jgi:lysine-N-methylase
MKEYFLNYYPKFSCVAEKCKHTCCAGWEMCIDSESLQLYKNEETDFSKELSRGIDFKKSKFKADKKGRCAFLNDSGLCEIIINLGEDSLCQVCRDHPRFRSFFSDRTETGLGFCCEEATRIILSFSDKIAPVLKKDDGEKESLSFIENSVLEFRQNILDTLQDRCFSINERIEKVLSVCNAQFTDNDFKRLVKVFLSFERLSKSWTDRLRKLKNKPFNKNVTNELELCAEQFLVNGIIRHLSSVDDTMSARVKVLSCVYSWWLVQSIYKNEKVSNELDFDLIVDVVREFSAEVEYSEKNLLKLFSWCCKI